MSQTLELEDIRRLNIGKGETLVATLPPGADPRDSGRVRQILTDLLPDAKILVVSHGVDLQVLCPSSPA